MVAKAKDIKIMLLSGTGIGTCFGLNPTRITHPARESEIPNEPKPGEGAAFRLLDKFEW